MPKSVVLVLLAQGNTGNEILTILDSIVADNVADANTNEPTLNEVRFWCKLCGTWLTLGATYVMIDDISVSTVFCGRCYIKRGGGAYINF